MANINIKAYGKENIKSQIAGANPYIIIRMLMQGALDRLAQGKGCIERKDLQGKSKCLSGASDIINALNESLDFDVGGEIAGNIGGLYDYMITRIADASIDNSPEAITEVINLLSEIKGAWDSIPPTEVDKALALQAEQV
ncbi:flagellar export chaperone FliS [Colwelliaceae bacterium 6441]